MNKRRIIIICLAVVLILSSCAILFSTGEENRLDGIVIRPTYPENNIGFGNVSNLVAWSESSSYTAPLMQRNTTLDSIIGVTGNTFTLFQTHKGYKAHVDFTPVLINTKINSDANAFISVSYKISFDGLISFDTNVKEWNNSLNQEFFNSDLRIDGESLVDGACTVQYVFFRVGEYDNTGSYNEYRIYTYLNDMLVSEHVETRGGNEFVDIVNSINSIVFDNMELGSTEPVTVTVSDVVVKTASQENYLY